MAMTWQKCIREVTPPILYRGLSLLHWRSKSILPPKKEKNAEWYDSAYNSTEAYHCHYTASHYYFMWTVVADRLRRSGACRILDLGCGPGQFASLLRDRGWRYYSGVDFSPRAIELAQQTCPDFGFHLVDLADSDVLEQEDYDVIVTMEFLEHVEFDLDVVRKIRPGTTVLATVPNFPYTSHVRHFNNEREVHERYASEFCDFRIDAFVENDAGKTYFLFEGSKT